MTNLIEEKNEKWKRRAGALNLWCRPFRESWPPKYVGTESTTTANEQQETKIILVYYTLLIFGGESPCSILLMFSVQLPRPTPNSTYSVSTYMIVCHQMCPSSKATH